jgi:hypothetical protein
MSPASTGSLDPDSESGTGSKKAKRSRNKRKDEGWKLSLKSLIGIS